MRGRDVRAERRVEVKGMGIFGWFVVGWLGRSRVATWTELGPRVMMVGFGV